MDGVAATVVGAVGAAATIAGVAGASGEVAASASSSTQSHPRASTVSPRPADFAGVVARDIGWDCWTVQLHGARAFIVAATLLLTFTIEVLRAEHGLVWRTLFLFNSVFHACVYLFLIIQFFMHARSRKSYVYFKSIFCEPNRFEIPPELGQS